MATDIGNDVPVFRSFLDQQISESGRSLTFEEAVELWKYETSSERERQETLAAVREGLEDLEAGRITPTREVLEKLRRNYQLSE